MPACVCIYIYTYMCVSTHFKGPPTYRDIQQDVCPASGAIAGVLKRRGSVPTTYSLAVLGSQEKLCHACNPL